MGDGGGARLASLDLDGVARYVLEAGVRNIVVLCGAGISTAAGIPDFRSPGTGLYDNLQQYDLPYPEAIFELDFFRQKPEAFYRLCREIFVGQYVPTRTHALFALLERKGVLRRVFTQNIDSLETAAGLPMERLVAAHGNLDSAHVIDGGPEVPVAEVQAALATDNGWRDLAEQHGGLVKPDIVFFGESLPERFIRLAAQDLAQADLLLVFGTSLEVFPFAGLIERVGDDVPRVLFNLSPAGQAPRNTMDMLQGRSMRNGFRFDFPENHRDVFIQGPADEGAAALAQRLGWGEELDAVYAAGRGAPIPEVAPAPWAR